MRFWKKLKRHPLSSEYPDITGRAWEKFVENLRQRGILGRRTITLHDGKVLDGWQLYRACVELNVKPAFQQLPKGIEPDAFVEMANDHRRHETQEQALKRIEERRQRVAEARAEGQSLATIADNEGISREQVRRDIRQAGVTHVTPEAPATVTGKDGKTYDAEKATIFCRNCRVGGKPKPNCPDCKAKREDEERPQGGDAEAERDAKRRRTNNGKPLFDYGQLKSAFGVMLRQVDELGKRYGAKESPQAESLRRELKNWKKQFEDWHLELKKIGK